MGRIGVLGGTFDPVHLGHLVIATELRFTLELDRVLWTPAGDPPHKPEQRLTDESHRVRMLELALAGHDGFEIDRIDLDRVGPSYTVDTVTQLKARHPDDEIVFLMGLDSLRDLHHWREPEQILRIARLGVAKRPDVEVDLAAVYERLPAARNRVSIVDVPLIGISSRDLRSRVASGRPISFQTTEPVEAYIRDHGLYRE